MILRLTKVWYRLLPFDFFYLIDDRNIFDVIDAQLVAFSYESKFQVIMVSDIFSATKVKVSDWYIIAAKLVDHWKVQVWKTLIIFLLFIFRGELDCYWYVLIELF